ncbi:hypothetical protein P3T86_14050 (plasmid) [Staphylococcus nepalensis]|uniref:hypothetical protein n=1 Tax=Staphylococcus nepalensis TaxID=214473 RepID=UPI002B2630C0|nr:hypothetical protein [Staphylococcus nepalensis]WQL21602.1 hypothetical protein P3T86_14050 [Staphylococcus nepalensis]
MKKIVMVVSIVLLIAFILFMFIFVNDNDDESSDKPKEENTKSNSESSDKPNEPQSNSERSNSSNNSNSKEYTTARDNAEKYVDMAYNYDLNTDYKDNKSIFSKSMFKQLQKYDKSSDGSKYGENDDISRSVSDITIYFDTNEEFPEKALYTAKVTADNQKEKNKMIRTVTGEIQFTEEQGQPKIDASKEITSEESEE